MKKRSYIKISTAAVSSALGVSALSAALVACNNQQQTPETTKQNIFTRILDSQFKNKDVTGVFTSLNNNEREIRVQGHVNAQGIAEFDLSAFGNRSDFELSQIFEDGNSKPIFDASKSSLSPNTQSNQQKDPNSKISNETTQTQAKFLTNLNKADQTINFDSKGNLQLFVFVPLHYVNERVVAVFGNERGQEQKIVSTVNRQGMATFNINSLPNTSNTWRLQKVINTSQQDVLTSHDLNDFQKQEIILPPQVKKSVNDKNETILILKPFKTPSTYKSVATYLNKTTNKIYKVKSDFSNEQYVFDLTKNLTEPGQYQLQAIKTVTNINVINIDKLSSEIKSFNVAEPITNKDLKVVASQWYKRGDDIVLKLTLNKPVNQTDPQGFYLSATIKNSKSDQEVQIVDLPANYTSKEYEFTFKNSLTNRRWILLNVQLSLANKYAIEPIELQQNVALNVFDVDPVGVQLSNVAVVNHNGHTATVGFTINSSDKPLLKNETYKAIVKFKKTDKDPRVETVSVVNEKQQDEQSNTTTKAVEQQTRSINLSSAVSKIEEQQEISQEVTIFYNSKTERFEFDLSLIPDSKNFNYELTSIELIENPPYLKQQINLTNKLFDAGLILARAGQKVSAPIVFAAPHVIKQIVIQTQNSKNIPELDKSYAQVWVKLIHDSVWWEPQPESVQLEFSTPDGFKVRSKILPTHKDEKIPYRFTIKSDENNNYDNMIGNRTYTLTKLLYGKEGNFKELIVPESQINFKTDRSKHISVEKAEVFYGYEDKNKALDMLKLEIVDKDNLIDDTDKVDVVLERLGENLPKDKKLIEFKGIPVKGHGKKKTVVFDAQIGINQRFKLITVKTQPRKQFGPQIMLYNARHNLTIFEFENQIKLTYINLQKHNNALEFRIETNHPGIIDGRELHFTLTGSDWIYNKYHDWFIMRPNSLNPKVFSQSFVLNDLNKTQQFKNKRVSITTLHLNKPTDENKERFNLLSWGIWVN